MAHKGRKLTVALALAILAALILSGCGTPDRPAQQSAAPPAAAPTAAAPAVARTSDRLYIRESYGDNSERLAVLDGASGAREHDLPIGVAASDWSAIYTAKETFTNSHYTTQVRAIDPKTGKTIRETTVDGGAYTLPKIGVNGTLGGLSPNGRWLVLEEAPGQVAGRWQSSMVVLDTAFAKPPRFLKFEFDGIYRFDGINDSGDGLYLIEYLSSGYSPKYQVRFYDLAKGELDPNVVVAKGEDPIMSGDRQISVPSSTGEWLFSLYTNENYGPFIHALNLNTRFAVCIDLPKDGKDDPEKQAFWSLAMSPGGSTLYAANGALNLVVELDTQQLQIRRTATLPAPSARTGPLDRLVRWLMPVAEAKPEHEPGAAGAVLSRDGKTLFVLGGQGLLAINTKDLTLRGRYLVDRTLNSIALSPDDARLYVTSIPQSENDQSKIVQLDSATGAVLVEISNSMRPMGVLRVEAQR